MKKKLFCHVCGKEIFNKQSHAKYCDDCVDGVNKNYQKKYHMEYYVRRNLANKEKYVASLELKKRLIDEVLKEINKNG